MAARSRPVFTENFSDNLAAIRRFLGDEGRDAFRALWKRFVREIVPIVCRLPRSGRPFLAHAIGSRDAQRLIQRLRRRLRERDEIRELVLDDFVILYLIRPRQVVFLAIKHHRQLSFDLKRFWASP